MGPVTLFPDVASNVQYSRMLKTHNIPICNNRILSNIIKFARQECAEYLIFFLL